MQWENGQRSHVQFYWHGPTLLSEEETRVEHGSEYSHSTQYVFKPGSFEPVAQVRDGHVQHIHTDHLGTPRKLSNSQGQWVWKARYRSYGALALKDDSAKEQNPAACKLCFQGQYWDEESGLHYNLNRYYDPESGQFTTQDPIGLAGGLNVYQYAPNPVTWVDPWGLTSKEDYGAKRVGAFADEKKLIGHFNKHGAEFGAKSADEYLQVGQDIMDYGQKVEYAYNGETRVGFVQFMGNRANGQSKFGFVGTNADGAITTIHTESGNSFWKMLNSGKLDKEIKTAP